MSIYKPTYVVYRLVGETIDQGRWVRHLSTPFYDYDTAAAKASQLNKRADFTGLTVVADITVRVPVDALVGDDFALSVSTEPEPYVPQVGDRVKLEGWLDSDACKVLAVGQKMLFLRDSSGQELLLDLRYGATGNPRPWVKVTS